MTEAQLKTVTVSLEMSNHYEYYDTVVTYETDAVVPAPPMGERDTEAFNDWAFTHLFQFTGAGHTDGDSWYDVTIVASSDPTLVGLDFTWGI